MDFCPLNFTAPGALDDLDEEHLVPLDRLNLKLVIANLDHCRAAGLIDAASGKRQPMSDIILETVPGA